MCMPVRPVFHVDFLVNTNAFTCHVFRVASVNRFDCEASDKSVIYSPALMSHPEIMACERLVAVNAVARIIGRTAIQ